MALINVTVVSERAILLPWKITSVYLGKESIQEFYERTLSGTEAVKSHLLSRAFLGSSKDSLDLIELNVELQQAIAMFGPFLKYVVTIKEGSDDSPPPRQSAVQVLMNAQRSLDQPRLPTKTTRESLTMKDVLFNSVVDFLGVQELAWRGTDADGVGKKFVSSLVDCLWYIDGRSHVFEKQGCKLPDFVSNFAGYNKPEVSKHRKRTAENMCSSIIRSHSSTLFSCLQSVYWSRPKFAKFKPLIEQLAGSLTQYSDLLTSHNKRMKEIHSSPVPIRQLSDSLSISVINKSALRYPRYNEIFGVLSDLEPYQHICLTDLCPEDPRERYRLITGLKNGLDIPVVSLTYSPGNNCGNMHFLWKYPDTESMGTVFERSIPVVEIIKPLLPQYHTRAMKRSLFSKFGRVTNSIKPAILRAFYREISGDCSASTNLVEAEIDNRVQLVLDMEPENPNTVIDLRSLNSSTGRAKYDVFWDNCSRVLNEYVGTAVDDRRHGQVVHLAQAISVRDFRDQVERQCPAGVPIPSLEWIRLQFWPKSSQSKQSCHYTGRLDVKFAIQRRQWRHEHIDAHYAAATFRYEREFAIKFRDHCTLACLDDKHRVKVGDPGEPLAAVDRGRRVLVHRNASFEVSDHDFSKFSIIPSVSLLVDIPTEISDSWYQGHVNVMLKEAAFEQSSPLRHACELGNLLCSLNVTDKPVLCLYTDGGSDHRLTFLSVKLALVCVFLHFDLDYLLAARTAPFHSWRNPVERIMSTLNLGLQSVGLERGTGDDQFESEAHNCNSLSALRRAAVRRSEFRQEALDCMEPVKILLRSIFSRLKLKDKSITTTDSARPEELDTLWNSLSSIGGSIPTPESLHKKSDLKSVPSIAQFLEHCTRQRHYFFEIRKCGEDTCGICEPIRLPREVFEQIKPFPDPMPGANEHYLPFREVYGSETTEEHRPSAMKKSSKQRSLPFHGKLQHVKNANMMIECEECGMWRLVYAQRKLNTSQRTSLERSLNGMSFSCGVPLQELDLGPELCDLVFVRTLQCGDPIEILYYTAKYEPICIYCAQPVASCEGKTYPQCEQCKDKPPITHK